MKNIEKKLDEVKDVEIENKVREVCNLLANYKPSENMTDFFIHELLHLEDTCRQLKCKLADF